MSALHAQGDPVASAPSDVLAFWFSDAAKPNWYAVDPAFDAEIRRRFAATFAAAASGRLAAWEAEVEGRLAVILILDQFSRNLHRGASAAYAQDAAALRLTHRCLRLGDDHWLKAHRPPDWRHFLYLPLMHSEDLSDQRRCVDLLLTHGPEEPLPYARAHLDVIARFGRFPHRNAVLGRPSTEEEARFLAQAGTGF